MFYLNLGEHLQKDLRFNALTLWLEANFSAENLQLTPLLGDAGFRRYYRFNIDNQSYIAVDSPSDKCNNTAFIAIHQALLSSGVNVPEIIAVAQEDGFFCLQDLGQTLLADKLSPESMQDYYRQAIELLPSIAKSQLTSDGYQLPSYDAEFIAMELGIFTEWLLEKYLKISLSDAQQSQLKVEFDCLINSALEQPQVTMHRDYHCRNLMLVDQQIVVIDFQDAVKGPITYDIVSLLRDCYVRWPQAQVTQLSDFYRNLVTQHWPDLEVSVDKWQRWFDLMGLQRHIKASGIFARLHLRDGKSGYLKDIPLTLGYIADIAAQYPEFNCLEQLIKTQVIPALTEKQNQDSEITE